EGRCSAGASSTSFRCESGNRISARQVEVNSGLISQCLHVSQILHSPRSPFVRDQRFTAKKKNRYFSISTGLPRGPGLIPTQAGNRSQDMDLNRNPAQLQNFLPFQDILRTDILRRKSESAHSSKHAFNVPEFRPHE